MSKGNNNNLKIKIMKKLVLGLATILVTVLTSCSSDSATSIEDTPETAGNTVVYMFKDISESEYAPGAYAIKLKTFKGIKYCALLGAGDEKFYPRATDSDLPYPAFETYATSLCARHDYLKLWVVVTWDRAYLYEGKKDKIRGDIFSDYNVVHATKLEKR